MFQQEESFKSLDDIEWAAELSSKEDGGSGEATDQVHTQISLLLDAFDDDHDGYLFVKINNLRS